jgi:hypothetical protein
MKSAIYTCALLCLAGSASAVTYQVLPYNTTIQPPAGPRGQISAPYSVDVVVTRDDANGTMYGQIEYVGEGAAGFCASIWTVVWDATGHLVSETETSTGCNKPWTGVFAASNLGQVKTVATKGTEKAYSEWAIGSNARTHWVAYFGH